jgi:2-polyprenyl-3-methyl-5-hydroxy-6-metoxy-1,4-benzoquinol methylase
MINWKNFSKDPNNETAMRSVSEYLRSITKVLSGNKTNYISNLCSERSVLDIGAGEHDINYFNENWEHAIYKSHAQSIVAIEIDNELCDFYNSKGFDFRCVDATSDQFIGQKFDVIYCGDVIEHVENSVNLLKFIDRHLNSNGICIITTPNPNFEKFKNITKAKSDLYFISNLEHISWIVPTHMLEIIRRTKTDLIFDSILIPDYAQQSAIMLGGNIECYFDEFIYVIRKP